MKQNHNNLGGERDIILALGGDKEWYQNKISACYYILFIFKKIENKIFSHVWFFFIFLQVYIREIGSWFMYLVILRKKKKNIVEEAMNFLKIKDMWTPRETCLSTLYQLSNPKKGISFASFYFL